MSDAHAQAQRLHETALALARRGQLSQAIPIWGEALRSDPDHVDTLVHLGHALAAVHERDKAAELASRAARLAPQQCAPWLLLGHLGLDRGALATALECYTLAARFAHDDEIDDVAVARTKALLRAGHRDEARVCLSRASADHVDALLLRAQLAADDGDPDAARALLVHAGERDPTHPEPYKALAVLLGTSDPTLARELLDHALALAPHDDEARALRAALMT